MACICFPGMIYFSVNVALITITRRHTFTFPLLPRCPVCWDPEKQSNHFPPMKQKIMHVGLNRLYKVSSGSRLKNLVVTYVWIKCHFSHFLEMKLDWQS